MPDPTAKLKVSTLLTDGEDFFNLRDLTQRTSESKSRILLEQTVDDDIDQFADYFCGELGNDPLAKAEKSIIKTYIAWKFGLGPKQERENA